MGLSLRDRYIYQKSYNEMFKGKYTHKDKDMASNKLLSAFHLTRLLLFMLLTSTTTFGDLNKVTLSLYYESMCPYCANFIVNQLRTIFQSDLISIVKLRLIPWGNTQATVNNTWICQHGVDECVLNIVEACAINLLPDLGLRFRFIQCIELLHLQDKQNQWRSCFGSFKINPKPISDCYQSRSGVDLELRYADETDHLNPPHRFVPWVVVNNKPLQDDYQNFVACLQGLPRSKYTPSLQTTSIWNQLNRRVKLCHSSFLSRQGQGHGIFRTRC